MARAASISNINIARTNDFNGVSVSNVTTHDLSFTLVGDPNTSYQCTVIIDTARYVRNVRGGNTVTIDIGHFDTGNADIVKKRIDISVIGSNAAPTVTAYATLTIYKYSSPDVVATVVRNENEQLVLTFIPTYQATVAGASNAISLFVARCDVNGEVYETDLKDKTSPQILVGTYDLAKTYQFMIAIRDSVIPSDIIKKVILPSEIPVMDIGADGRTVTFFGTSPSSSDKNALRIGDVASFGEEIILGNNSNLTINKSNIEFNKDNKKQLLFGEDDIIIPNTIGEIKYKGKGVAVKSPTKNIVVSTLQTKDESNTSKGGKSALELYYDSENDIVGFALSAKKGTSYTDLYESEGRGLFMEYGTYDSANEADIFLSGDNTNVDGTNTFISGDEYVRIESNKMIHCQAPGLDVKLGQNNILWNCNNTAYWMIGAHDFTLNQPISKQLNGAVFVWSAYTDGTIQNWGFNMFFVPKQHVIWFNGAGIDMSNPYAGLRKYIYVADTHFKGNDGNSATGSDNGIPLKSRNYILRYVVGV